MLSIQTREIPKGRLMKLTRLCFIGMVCAGIVALGRLVKELRPLSLSLLVRMTACVALLWLFAPVAQADSPTVGASASYLVTTGAIGGGSNVDTDSASKTLLPRLANLSTTPRVMAFS
jgi:hypothetical protein